MKHYVQLQDGIVFAAHSSSNSVDDSGPNVWEVETSAEDKLGKAYNNGQFSDAPIIKYAIIDSNGTVVDIEQTIYSSKVNGPIITSNDVKIFWKWDGEKFIDPSLLEEA